MEAASTRDHLRPVASATWHACRGHVLQRCKRTGTFIRPELKAEGSRSDMSSCYLPGGAIYCDSGVILEIVLEIMFREVV